MTSKNTQSFSLPEIAKRLSATLEGDESVIIEGIGTLAAANKNDITFYANRRYSHQLASTQAGCVLVKPQDSHMFTGNKLIVDDPYLAFAILSEWFVEPSTVLSGVHPSAVIAEDVELGKNVSIGANVTIDQGSVIEDNVVINAGSYLGPNTTVGKHSLLHANVTLCKKVKVGNHCIIHSGAVIGADGFGFAPSSSGWQKIYQLGGVRLGDKVEVGAGTTIDCGAIEDTVLGDGVKVDNQVQIAHNVQIGDNTAIAAATAIAGSTVIGKRCTIAGCVGIVGHIEIVDDVHITGMSMVSKSIKKAGSYSSGVPMAETAHWRKNAARFTQLDDLFRRVKAASKN